MKLKSLLLIFMLCLIVLLMPSCVQAYENVDEVGYGNGKYKLYDDGTAELIYLEPDTVNGHSLIHEFVPYNEEEYDVTIIDENAFVDIIQEQDLWIYFDNAVQLESGISFDNIDDIYVSDNVDKESFETANWPVEKLKVYDIIKQPIDKVVTAGNITDADTLEILVDTYLATSKTYSWYFCDKDGNITDTAPFVDDSEMESIEENNIFGVRIKIPNDLSYNHESNTSKDYYFVCVIGEYTDVPEKSRVVKVTVNPGTYKVTFHLSTSSNVNPVVLNVNDERKLESSDLSKIPTLDKLNQYKEGATFLGWTTDGTKVIKQDDLETMVFDKNMDFYPVWQTKITIDANGGKFEDGSTKFVYTITNFGEVSAMLPEPIREGYEVVDLIDESGKSIFEYDGYEEITKDLIFYVQWKSLTGEGGVGTGNGSGKGDKDETPGTGENILPYEVIFTISSVGLATMFVTSKNKIRKH